MTTTSTKIDILADNSLSIALLNAMAESIPRDKFTEYFNITPEGDDTQVELTILVNGKPVDLVSELVRCVKHIESCMNDLVLKKATELI